MKKNILQITEQSDIMVRTYNDIYNRLKSIALSRFKWNNLPEFCNERFLERVLYENGIACFSKHKEFGQIMNFRVTPSNEMNVYEEFTKYVVYSINYRELCEREQIVIVRNNALETDTKTTIELYAYRLTNLLMTIDVNVESQKTPIVIACDEKERMSYKNAYKQRQLNEPVIFGSKQFSTDNFKVLNTQAPYIADKIRKEYTNVWNECLTYLGINNVQIEKKERLIQDEVNGNNELIYNMQETFLKTRRESCNEINKKFGTNISVEFVKEVKEVGEIYY